MGMTMTQKILAAHCGQDGIQDDLREGQLIEARLDLVLGNDITSPVSIKAMKEAGITRVKDPGKIVLVMDHFVPNKDIKAAGQVKICREFAREQDIEHYYDAGQMGIEHCFVPEQGLVSPGDCVIGADSHTCTYGALGAFSTGVGSTDMAAGMAAGTAWFKVPGAVRFLLSGGLTGHASGKDLILHIIGMIGVEGARYLSMEFCGDGVRSLGMDDRFTICNMAVEAGAKNGIFPVDEVTEAYCEGRCRRPGAVYRADADAAYQATYEIDLSAIKPTVSLPSLPSNTKIAEELGEWELPIQQAVIGSCTNGRMSDLRAAANILKNRKTHKNVRCIVIPGTQRIYLEALREGLVETFIEAGCVVTTPTCGPCLGGHMGVLAEGERAISTTNRNFVGRMGHVKSEVVLGSPATAAASAIAGYVTAPGKN